MSASKTWELQDQWINKSDYPSCATASGSLKGIFHPKIIIIHFYDFSKPKLLCFWGETQKVQVLWP